MRKSKFLFLQSVCYWQCASTELATKRETFFVLNLFLAGLFNF